jgi:hypothetical protein
MSGWAEVVHMRRAFVLFVLAALPAVVFATQSRPNFNGRWVAIQPETIAGQELLIVQDGSTVRIEQVRIDARETYDRLGRRVDAATRRESTTYRLDGEPTVTGRAQETVRSSLIEQTDAFILRDIYQGLRLRFERRLSFDADGRLVVEQLQRPVSQDPDRASETVLDVGRVVYERR